MNYSIKLVDLREKLNLKQKDVAKCLGISPGLYNIYETEYKVIPSKYLNSLSNVLNTSIDYIFGLTSKKNYSNSKKEIDLQISKNRLKEFRHDNNLTQKQLAKELKISQSVVSDFEKGNKVIPTIYLYEISKRYDISADYLLGKKDSKEF